MPVGRDGMLASMTDMRLYLSQDDPQTALGMLKPLEEMFGGDRSSLGIA